MRMAASRARSTSKRDGDVGGVHSRRSKIEWIEINTEVRKTYLYRAVRIASRAVLVVSQGL